MTYQLVVNSISAEEIMRKIISLPRRSTFHKNLSMFDSLDDNKTVEITFSVDSLSVNVEEMEKKLNEAVASSESNVISWKKLD
mgnify:CR=1 FL=1